MKTRRMISGVLAALLVVSAAGCGSTPKKPAFTVPGNNYSRTADPVGFQFDPPKKGETIVVFHTSMGDIKARLFPDSAPIAVTNFEALVKKGYYNGLIFHRVINDFMIQGGDPKGDGTGGQSVWGSGFENEFNRNLLHFTGALSMAHSSEPNSNGSQFFIVQGAAVTEEKLKQAGADTVIPDDIKQLYYQHGGAFNLDGIINKSGHSVFGQVFEGMDVVNAIAGAETDDSDKPVTDVVMNKVELVTYE